MGSSEVLPISGGCNEWLGSGTKLGLTIMDSLDTMLIMGLNDFYIRGRDYLKKNLNFDVSLMVPVFETNIRILGGLLAAYGFTEDPFLLERAEDLARRLKPAFGTPSGYPQARVNLKTGHTGTSSLSLSPGQLLI
jgi:mannosyl-oligosaccharide alpha-1,2-mannosidase